MSTDRWLAYIGSHSECWRNLYLRPNVEHRCAANKSDDNLKRFLSCLENSGEDSLLKFVHYMMQPSLQDFANSRMPILLRSLAKSVDFGQSISAWGARGKIDWQRTLLKRSQGTITSGSFVCRNSISSYDTPENQLLLYFIKSILSVVFAWEKKYGSGSLPASVMLLKQEFVKAVKSCQLNNAKEISRVGIIHKSRCRRMKNIGYAQLLDLYIQFFDVLMESKWSSIAALIGKGWTAPVKSDDLFELYSLVRVLDCLKQSGRFGNIERYGLIRFNRSEIVKFKRDDGAVLSVYFDQSFATIVHKYSSNYQNILTSHGFQNISPRRPDMILKFEKSGVEKYLIIECKETDNEKYIRDSVYKCFGYLYDFKAVWNDTSQVTKIILLISNPPKVFTSSYVSQEVKIFSAEDPLLTKFVEDSLDA
jgi:hypothetical protein